MFHATTLRATLALAAASLLSGGCDLVDALAPAGGTLITVFANHQATTENGTVPDRGGAGELRVFENDLGWTVHLAEGLVTTTGVTLERCDGRTAPVDFYFGTVAEDLRSADIDRRTLGGAEVGKGSFCGMVVHYGPFSAATDQPPSQMDPSKLDGATVYLTGFAQRGEERVRFEIAAPKPVDVFVDLSSHPIDISGNEAFPVEVTVTKVYDRFFDGVDFADSEQEDLVANATAMLELETIANVAR